MKGFALCVVLRTRRV